MNNEYNWLIAIGNNDEMWAEIPDSVPSILREKYNELRELIKIGQAGSCILMIKDIFELAIRIPFVMSLVVMNDQRNTYDEEQFTEYLKLMADVLFDTLSMGKVKEISNNICAHSEKIGIPNEIKEILERTCDLLDESVSDWTVNIVNWRNNEIGHGVLRFASDLRYQVEVENILLLLKKYFEGEEEYSIEDCYEGVCFSSDRIGPSNGEDDHSDYLLELNISSDKYNASEFINIFDDKRFFFDTYYSNNKKVKVCSYWIFWSRLSHHSGVV